MRIKKVELKNFKRFTDLTISDIPETSKLVLLIGSNGSGKSSVFDAFDWLGKGLYKHPHYNDNDANDYYSKQSDTKPFVQIELHDGRSIEKNDGLPSKGKELAKQFIGRSSIRIVPRILNTANPDQIFNDTDSPSTYIENDIRFINDAYWYNDIINKALREPTFRGQQADTVKIFREFIEPLNNSLLKIFGGTGTTTIQIVDFQDVTPNSPAKPIFKKGSSKITYDLLSHGEKQVIILLINFIVREEYYKDCIIFIDEMDCHLNTALQFNLLHEIVTKWIPNNSQLWTASHALGFIDYAKKNVNASIIDLDLLDFDTKIELFPTHKDNLEVYEIALPKETINTILKGYTLVVAENQNAKVYNDVLGPVGYLFLPANNNREVFLTVKGDETKLGLRDRDYLRPDEIAEIKTKQKNLKILEYYTFENYIYHPDNFAELGFEGYNKDEYVKEIISQKNEHRDYINAAIGTSRNHYIEFKDCIKNDGDIKSIVDDLKSNEFEVFYPYFNMKDYFNKKYLEQFKYTIKDLHRTEWFKERILKIVKN